MKISIERSRRGPTEGVALCVRAFDHPRQFKIDVWSELDSGEYHMRLDGFGYLRIWQSATLQALLARLAAVDVADVVRQALEMHRIIAEAFVRWKEGNPTGLIEAPPAPAELEIAEFFQTCRQRVLVELAPLGASSQN
jgi:hypothetical protein